VQQRRAFLLDASCRLFARAVQARGYAARYVVPRHGEAAFPGEEASVERVLPYPYARRYGTIDGSPQHPLDPQLHAILERHLGEPRQRLATLALRPLADRRITLLLAGAFAPELDRLDPGPGDLVMLPTADLYATGALLAWLAGRPPSQAPAVLLRFLNILETEGLHRPYERLKALLRRAAALKSAGHRIVVTAEVEPWAARLERRSGFPTLLLPTPPEPVTPRPRDPQRLGVSLLSLRRGEQGSRRLVPILQALPADLRGRLDIVGQASRWNGEALRAEGVRLVDNLSESALAATLATLDVTLLPYRAEDYATRGSSMLFEAANHAHLVLASAGCGFSGEAESFGLGSLCATDQEFSAALAALVGDTGFRARSQGAAARYNAYRERQVEVALRALES
jgi:hypothetical protein